MNVVDLLTREGFSRRGVQLTAVADWHAAAAWCGGTLVEASHHGLLMLPDGSTAGLDDWVVELGAMGCFIAWTPAEAQLLYVPADPPP